MNANKKNGWILCPSTTFPGKFYYFNVSNGETAWTLSDTEKKNIKISGYIPKMSNYPHIGPTSPPKPYEPVKTGITINQAFSRIEHAPPIFGQLSFSKALPTKPEEPNVIWTPIQIGVPIVFPQERNYITQAHCQETQVTPTFEAEEFKPTLDKAKGPIVQASNKPLCQRFINYENPVIIFGKNNKIENKGLFDRLYTPTPTKPTTQFAFKDPFQAKTSLWYEDLRPKTQKQIKITIPNIEVPSKTHEKNKAHENGDLGTPIEQTNPFTFQAKTSFGFEDLRPKTQKQIIKKTILNIEVPSKTPEKNTHKVADYSDLRTAIEPTTPFTFQAKTSFGSEDLRPKTQKQIKITIPNIEVPSKTHEKNKAHENGDLGTPIEQTNPFTFQPKTSFGFEDLRPKTQKQIIKKTILNIEVPSKTPEKNTDKVADYSDLRTAIEPTTPFTFQAETSFCSEDLRPKTQKQIIKKTILNIEVPSKTPEKNTDKVADYSDLRTAIEPTTPFTFQAKTSFGFEDLRPKTQKQIIKKTILNIDVPAKTPEKNTDKETEKAVMRTPIKTNSITSNDPFQAKTSFCSEDLRPRAQQQVIKQSVLNVKVPSITPERNQDKFEIEKGDLRAYSHSPKVDLAMARSSARKLKVDDLRMLLVSKKRKSQDLGFGNKDEIKSKIPKKSMIDLSSQPKKVTFNLDNEELPAEHDMDENIHFEDNTLTLKFLKDLAAEGTTEEYWYIVMDTNVLLEEYSFLDSFVQNDPKCKLLIPDSVFAEVSALARGECRGRTRVNLARNVIRRLNNPHTIVQKADCEGADSPINDSILKCCVETMDRNIHLILITNNQELQTTAKFYPIRCYNVQSIKNGLAPKPMEFKQMKITIKNDREAVCNKNLTVHSYKLKLFDENEDFNEKEKEIIRNFYKQISDNNTEGQKTKIINDIPVDTNDHSRNLSPLNCYDENLSIEKAVPIVATEDLKHDNTHMMLEPNSKMFNDKSMITNENQMIANCKSDTSLSKANRMIPSSIYQRFPNENSDIPANDLTKWRCTVSDITETSLELEMKKLSISGTYVHKIPKKTQTNQENSTQKTPEKSQTTLERNSKETVSFFFQTPTAKFDFQKLKSINLKRQNVQEFPLITIETTKRSETTQKPVFEVKEPHVKDKSNMAASIFEINEFETTKSIRPVNGIKNNIDLSRFYVKSKIMENRLKERTEEWVCSFKQIMEESLSGVLEKITVSYVKFMSSPWTLYEALQRTKIVYKEHYDIKNIIDELCTLMYDNSCKNDKLKENIKPDDLIKGFGCGIELIKYLKNILPQSLEIQEAEEALQTMLNQIEDPECDVYEPLVKPPKVLKPDDKEIRLNFVKNRSEIIKYLKKHYPEWKHYDEDQIIRTTGKDPIELTNKGEAIGLKVAGNTVVKKNDNINNELIQTEVNNNGNTKDGNAEKGIATAKISCNVIDRSKSVKVQAKSAAVTKNKGNTDGNISNKPISNTETLKRNKIITTDLTKIPSAKVCLKRMKVTTGNMVKNDKITMKNSVTTGNVVKNDNITKKNACNNTNTEKKSKNIDYVVVKDTEGSDIKHITNDVKADKLKKTLIKAIDNSVDPKVVPTDAKTKKKSIFDFVKPKKDNVQKESKFKIDSKILDFKITVPNDYKARKAIKNLANDNSRDNEKHKINHHEIKQSDVKKGDDTDKKLNINKDKTTAKVNENDPKVIRNVNVIKEFEERIQKKCLEDELDEYSLISSQSLESDETHANTKDSKSNKNGRNNHINGDFNHRQTNDNLNQAKNDSKVNNLLNKDYKRKYDDQNQSEKDSNESGVNNHSDNDCYINKDLKKYYNNLKNDDNNSENNNTHSETGINDAKHYKKRTNMENDEHFSKNSANDRKNDDMTNDSGLGIESPRYSIVKSFSAEIKCALDNIEKYIDGYIQEFREGKLNDGTKTKFRLKAFEANFITTKIIIQLKKLMEIEQNGSGSGEKDVTRNTEALSNCLEQAQTLHRVLNVMLSATNEEIPIKVNSSMSLNSS